MKKLFVVLAAIFSAGISQAQSFGPHQMFVDAGIGLGIQHYRFTDITNNIVGQRDTSGAVEIPFGFEYGLLPFLGAKLEMNYAKYITDSTSNNSKYRTFDVVPEVTLHAPFNLNKLDIYASLGYGYTRFMDDYSSGSDKATARANGTVFNFGFCLRFLFKTDGHIGMQFWYRHSSYNYKNGELTDGNISWKFALDGPGNNFGLGFYGRFGN